MDWNSWTTTTNNDLKPETQYGSRVALTTFVHASDAPRPGDIGRGAASQQFVVPNNAFALRFVVHGGAAARVTLSRAGTVVYSASGDDSNVHKTPIGWDLEPYRGATMILAVEDNATSTWRFVGTTGFDVITETHGP